MKGLISYRIKRQAWCCAALMVVCGLLVWFRQYPILVEQYYGNGLYPYIAAIMQSVFGWLPFSFGDLFYVAVVLLGLSWVYRLIRCLLVKASNQALLHGLKLVNLSLALYMSFYVLWGLNYYREPLAQRLSLHEMRLTFADLLEVTEYCIEQANALKKELGATDIDWPNDAIYREAAMLMQQNKSLGDEVYRHKPKAKASIFNVATNYMGVSGYFNPYTHESHVNSTMPVVSRPFTACHELAHQAGVGFEDEANLVGFILANESSVPLFRYSAYFEAMWKLLNDVFYKDPVIYQYYYLKIDQAILDDAIDHNAYWSQYSGAVNAATNTFYNHYLEANNQPEGMERYNRMVGLLVGWYMRDKGC